MPQQGTIPRYFRVDADHDISADAFQFSSDGGVTWVNGTFVPQVSWPASVAARDALHAPASGFAGYWFTVQTGPANGSLPLNIGTVDVIGKLTDNPNSPRLGWKVVVATYE